MAGKKKTAESTFSSYELGKPVGEGGAGRVYEAVDVDGREWALKVLHRDKATAERRKRFKNEILFCRSGRHPNIIEVVDDGLIEEDGGTTPFYVMPRYASSLRTVMPKLADYDSRIRKTRPDPMSFGRPLCHSTRSLVPPLLFPSAAAS